MVDAEKRKIVPCAFIRRHAHDSSVFQKMFKKIPNSTECVMLDARYSAIRNYMMIHDTGRKAVICTRKNYVARGFNPRAKMIRWQEKNLEECENIYHQCSMMKSGFLSFKCWFTVVICKNLSIQSCCSGASATFFYHSEMMQNACHVSNVCCVTPCSSGTECIVSCPGNRKILSDGRNPK